ncbi:hypothetical protein ACXYMX_14860 [Sporosarcina sp. CAU 1771]
MKKLAIVFVIILAGCSPSRFLPGLAQETIDWVDAVKINDSMYYANYEMNDSGVTFESGSEIGEVHFNMDGHANSSYKMKNNDATYLSKGTKIYEMKDYAPAFRVIANGKVFEIGEPGHAKLLGDFLDIEGKVDTVRFVSYEDDSLIGELSEKLTKAFVEELLALPYEPDAYKTRNTDGYAVFLEIVLTDGSITRTSYWPESKFIWYGAIATDRLNDLLVKELAANGF